MQVLMFPNPKLSGADFQYSGKIQKQPTRRALKKKLFWKYTANLQENTHAKVWFQ